MKGSTSQRPVARSPSGFADGAESLDGSEIEFGSEASQQSTPSHRISQSKQMLAEAMQGYTPSLSICASRDNLRNSGASGALCPLLTMVQSCHDPEKLHRCFETLNCLLKDKVNCQAVSQMGGLDMLLGVLARHGAGDPFALRTAVECVVAVAGDDGDEKVRVWSSPSRAALLGLCQPSAGARHMISSLFLIHKLSFRGVGPSLQLLEPGVLIMAADLLLPGRPHNVLMQICKLLKFCADAATPDHLTAWHNVLFRLVPLLREPGVVEAALAVLAVVAEHKPFRNVFMATGAIAPLMTLLVHPSLSIAVTASCLVVTLSEGGLSRDELACEHSLVALLKALSHSPSTEVCVGVLYTLSCLADSNPGAKALLQAQGTSRLLLHKLSAWSTTDHELALGAHQLLDTLSIPDIPRSGSCSAGCSTGSLEECAAAETQIFAAACLDSPVCVMTLRRSSSGSMAVLEEHTTDEEDQDISFIRSVTSVRDVPALLRAKSPLNQSDLRECVITQPIVGCAAATLATTAGAISESSFKTLPRMRGRASSSLEYVLAVGASQDSDCSVASPRSPARWPLHNSISNYLMPSNASAAADVLSPLYAAADVRRGISFDEVPTVPWGTKGSVSASVPAQAPVVPRLQPCASFATLPECSRAPSPRLSMPAVMCSSLYVSQPTTNVVGTGGGHSTGGLRLQLR